MTRMFHRSVVLGCGIAGIAAAAALRPFSDEVIIVERDQLPCEPKTRRGVPQGEQLHNLLSCAQVRLEELLPGFCTALARAGAATACVSKDTRVFELGVEMPQRDLGLSLMCARRPVIEHVARGLLLEGGGVTIRDCTRGAGLELSPKGEIAGVVVESNGAQMTIETSLVVDASGVSSLAHRWLEAVGGSAPRVDVESIAHWYATMSFEHPPGLSGDPSFWLVFPTERRTRGGLVSPVGDGHWYVSLSGCAGDDPPRNVDEFRAYAGTLEVPWIADLLREARPVECVNLFRKLTATWRRYDCLPSPVPGFLPIGDSVANLNPLFGHGMSVAAWQAVELADLLGRFEAGSGVHALTSAYLQRASAACQAAWSLNNLGIDLLRGPPGAQADSSRDYGSALGRMLHADPELHRRYVGVWHLVEPVSVLQTDVVKARWEDAAKQMASRR